MIVAAKSFGVVLAAILFTSCSDNNERNIILETSPFYSRTAPLDPRNTENIITVVRQVAKAHGMDFLLARESLPAGDFNVTAARPELNLNVMHSGTFDHGTMVISAISRGRPTNTDMKVAREFDCAVSGKCK
jgi:hypothetical protein